MTGEAMVVETGTSDLVVRLAKMGSRLQAYATALRAVGVGGAVVVLIVGFVVAVHTKTDAAGVHTNPYVGIGIAICVSAFFIAAFVIVLSRVVEVLADYVSAAHLIGVSRA